MMPSFLSIFETHAKNKSRVRERAQKTQIYNCEFFNLFAKAEYYWIVNYIIFYRFFWFSEYNYERYTTTTTRL